MGKSKIKVDKKKCLACGGCISICPQNALYWYGEKASINEENCSSCALCIQICPIGAIQGEGY
jgi:Fe-S-cluster-containing hydrogenase component 2